jgi:hypothetical protein
MGESMGYYIGFGIFSALVLWYTWYVGIYIPEKMEKMTPEQRENFIKEWNEAGKWDIT